MSGIGAVCARAVVALVVAFIMAPATVQAQPIDPAYGWKQQQVEVAPGALCTLSVYVNADSDSLGCVECRVSFDPDAVTLVGASEGSLFTTAGVPGLFFADAVAPDTQSVEGCLLGYRTYGLAPGELVRLVFQAGAPGVTRVRIEALRVWDINRDVMQPLVDPNAWIVIGTTTGIGDTPRPHVGLRAFPNPFNPSTTLQVAFGEHPVTADLTIYSASGQVVKQLYRGVIDSPKRSFEWNGTNDRDRRVTSGVYFAVLTAGRHHLVRKLVLVE